MLPSGVCQVAKTLARKKQLEADILATPLKRCLNLFDLMLFGIGHMVGAGIYVVTGTVAKNIAGPGIVLSYLISGIAAMLSALCYAEFGARVPKAGSAYTYTYVIMGEVFAFFIGWNMILEYVIGTASVARAWSGSFDSLFDGAIRNATLEHLGSVEMSWISEYMDWTALLVTLVFVMLIAAGAKVSTNFNSVLTVINLAFLVVIITAGIYLSDTYNWGNTATGGFLPHGFRGVLAGAGSCFYAYIGFEGIAIAGEETLDPAKTLPRATGLAVSVASLLYISCATVLTMMVPWTDISIAAPFPMAFSQRGLHWAKYIVAVGSLVGISTSLLGSLFSLPRTVYAMASDGLLFRWLATVNTRTQTPLLAVVLFGLFTALTAMLFDLEVLVELMSIGTLFSYTFVAACVIMLHYEPADTCQFTLRPETEQQVYRPSTELQPVDQQTPTRFEHLDIDAEAAGSEAGAGEAGTECLVDDDRSLPAAAAAAGMNDDKRCILSTSQSHSDIGKLKNAFQSLPGLRHLAPGTAPVLAVSCMLLFMVCLLVLVLRGTEFLVGGAWWIVLLIAIFSVGLVLSFLLLLTHERNTSFTTFQVPLSPLLPALSMLFNIAMMVLLNHQTWLRLLVWLSIGLLIYLCYGVWHSDERQPLLSQQNNTILYNSATTARDQDHVTSPTDSGVQQLQQALSDTLHDAAAAGDKPQLNIR